MNKNNQSQRQSIPYWNGPINYYKFQGLITINELGRLITSDFLKEKVKLIRATNSQRLKARLPFVTVSGQFYLVNGGGKGTRMNEMFLWDSFTNYFAFETDEGDSDTLKPLIVELHQRLTDRELLLCFASPRKNGIKWIVEYKGKPVGLALWFLL